VYCCIIAVQAWHAGIGTAHFSWDAGNRFDGRPGCVFSPCSTGNVGPVHPRYWAEEQDKPFLRLSWESRPGVGAQVTCACSQWRPESLSHCKCFPTNAGRWLWLIAILGQCKRKQRRHSPFSHLKWSRPLQRRNRALCSQQHAVLRYNDASVMTATPRRLLGLKRAESNHAFWTSRAWAEYGKRRQLTWDDPTYRKH